MRVAVLGQGHVGLALGLSVVGAGHTVLAVESDPDRLRRLQASSSYIVDVTDDALRDAWATGRFLAVPDLTGAGADVYLIAVPTPVTEVNEPDLHPVDTAVAMVAESAVEGALIVVESTIYPGALRHHVAPLFERLSGLRPGRDVYMGYSPERIDPGSGALLVDIPKLVSGLDEKQTKELCDFYHTVFTEVVPISTTEVAEFAKLFENTFRYVNIAFANELGRAARSMGVNFREVVAAASSKPYGFIPFHYGPGVGGHCLPNNAHYLDHALRRAGSRSSLLTAASRVNDGQPSYVAERLITGLREVGRSIEDAVVLILGLAYKAGVSDARNSPTIALSDALAARGAVVRVADPGVSPIDGGTSFARVDLTVEQCAQADAVVLVTGHDDVDYELVLQHSTLVLDCRGMLDSPRIEQL